MPWERLIWLAPAAVAAAGLYRPRWGVLVFVACLPLFGSPPGGPYLAALDAAALTLVVVSLRAQRPPRAALTWPVVTLAVVAIASLLPAAYSPPSASPRGLLRLASTLHGVESWTALYTWRAALDLMLGIGLYHAIRRSWWRRNPSPLGAALAVGMVSTAVLGLLEFVEFVDLSSFRAIGRYVAVERMHSLFFNSGWLAEYFVVGAPFAVACLLALEKRRPAVALAVLSLAVVALTQQRGAWFSSLAQLAMLGVLTRKLWARRSGLWRPLAVGAAGLGLLLALVIAAGPQTRSDALKDRLAVSVSDLAGRQGLWQASLAMAPERPLLGWGIGSFAPVYDSFYPPGSPDTQRPRGTAHNWYLNVLVETGVLGLACLVLLILIAGGLIRHRLRRAVDEERILMTGVAVSLGGALVYGLVQYMPFLRVVHWLLWIILAVTALEPGPALRRWQSVSLAAVVVATLLCVPVRTLAGAPAWRGDRAYGFCEPGEGQERRFQWAGPRVAIRVPWVADCVRIPLANGHSGPEHRTEVTIRAAGNVLEAEPSRSWTDYQLDIGPPRTQSVLVEIDAEPSFRPFQDFERHGLAPSRDIRLLAVAVGDIATEPCAPARNRLGRESPGP